MIAPAPVPVLKRFYNLNNVLMNEYFGEFGRYKDNWQDMIGKQFIVEHNEIKVPLQVEMVGCFLVCGYEIEKEMDWIRYSDFCPPTTIRELCGFDDDNFKKWAFKSSMTTEKGILLYIFKNLNF